jgi:hypothetical protein
MNIQGESDSIGGCLCKDRREGSIPQKQWPCNALYGTLFPYPADGNLRNLDFLFSPNLLLNMLQLDCHSHSPFGSEYSTVHRIIPNP